MSEATAFAGSVPKTYHAHLVPLIFEDYARDLVARLGPCGGQRILELACGTGVVTREIARAMPSDATLIATDINEAMIEVARPYVGADARVKFQKVDACELPFADASFDAIVCQYGVMFFPDRVKAMREARRVLVPGGRYLFNVWDSLEHNPIPRAVHETVAAIFPENPPMFLAKMPYGWSDRGEIERVVRAGGFANCTIETVGFPCVAPTAEDAARGFIEGTPLLAGLAERGVKDPVEQRRAATKVLAEKFGERPCRSTKRAVVVVAS